MAERQRWDGDSAYGSGIETILSEARKFGVAVVSANQFLDQYPAEMRAAILAVGTHVFFQLSSTDATQVAQALDGGNSLAERLRNLYQRHAIVKSGADRPLEITCSHRSRGRCRLHRSAQSFPIPARTGAGPHRARHRQTAGTLRTHDQTGAI